VSAEPIPGDRVSVQASEGVYCVTGRHTGLFRVDLRLSVYLTPEEFAAMASHGFLVAVAEPRGG